MNSESVLTNSKPPTCARCFGRHHIRRASAHKKSQRQHEWSRLRPTTRGFRRRDRAEVQRPSRSRDRPRRIRSAPSQPPCWSQPDLAVDKAISSCRCCRGRIGCRRNGRPGTAPVASNAPPVAPATRVVRALRRGEASSNHDDRRLRWWARKRPHAEGSRFRASAGPRPAPAPRPKAREAQFTGEEQADRAGAGDHDIIDQRQVPLEPWRRRISEFGASSRRVFAPNSFFCQSLILVEATPTTTSIAATTVRLAGRPNSPDSSPIIAGPTRDPA